MTAAGPARAPSVSAASTAAAPVRSAVTVAVIGAGVNGRAAARTFVARGREVLLWDLDEQRALEAAEELGAGVAASREQALAADVVVTVTPGHEPLFEPGSLRAGQHVSLMGADGPGKAEIAVEELVRTHVFCDDWEQASHNGELAHAVGAGALERGQVTELGAVLAGDADGRRTDDEITTFDSTGLAIQDLAIALAAMERADELDLPELEL
ncbi:MAG TPA: NAD(P)-binding domain-containing protein [Planctomycetota bacterium]|nr:NAD(P)-binding domain-containing protein [Planctomycetota bacterium]